MLGGLALKWRWRERMRAAGKPVDRPNLVMGINVQVCWDKFCRYWDVEPRLVPMEGDRFHLTGDRRGPLRREHDRRRRRSSGRRSTAATSRLQEICDGPRRPGRRRRPRRPRARRRGVRRLHRPVRRSPTSTGTSSSRGCSRSTPRATSTASCTPASGWAIWRDAEALPDDLVFNVNYLGGEHADVRAELLAAGQRGRGAVLHVPQPRARGLSRRCSGPRAPWHSTSPPRSAAIGPYRLITDGSELPVLAFALKPGSTTTRSSTSRTRCASAAGWFPPTRSRRTGRTSRCCASSCARA